VYDDMWVDPDDDPRDTGTPLRGEKAVLVDYLRTYRLTLDMKCEGLDAEQLARRSVPPSTMSLLGLVRHMAAVEFSWFRRTMGHQPDLPRPYKSEDDNDLDFNGAIADPEVVAEAFATWRGEIAHAEHVVEHAESLDVQGYHPDGPLELREVLVHMIEEYARHCGHADLLREAIDGRVGQ
jgi:uncharacterized damage-inducible protein DinB